MVNEDFLSHTSMLPFPGITHKSKRKDRTLVVVVGEPFFFSALFSQFLVIAERGGTRVGVECLE